MEIFRETPDKWQDLEILVAKLLNQCGFIAKRDKQISTVRGTVNIDVFAEDRSSVPLSTYLVECKYWKAEIPQSVIHSFRTVVSDYGAQHGIIVAKKGFQSGAYEATQNTNVLLLSWSEFLALFESRWLKNRIKNNHYTAKPLQIYIDPLDVSEYLKSLSKDEIARYKELCRDYMKYSIYAHELTFTEISNLPVSNKEQINNVIHTAQRDLSKCTFNCYNDFFEHIEQKSLEGIKKFEELFKNTGALLHVKKYS